MSTVAANATLVERTPVAESMATFRLALDSPLTTYRPGQYVSLGVGAEGSFVQRPYSIVSVEEAGALVELFVRRVEGGALSPRLWGLAIGERVKVGAAKGLFVLDENDLRTRVFVGTGTGLAPLVAMLARLADVGDPSPNVLVHGVAMQSELGYRERIESWIAGGLDLWYIPTVSRPDDPANRGWNGPHGRADAVLEQVLQHDPSLCGGRAYLCGNPGMLESVTEVLVRAGMRAEDVHSERFAAPATVAQRATAAEPDAALTGLATAA